MTKRLFILVFSLLFLLVGCGSNPVHENVVEVKVPVSVPCKIEVPEKPAMPLQSSEDNDNIFVKVKKALAEIELRKGYEKKLEAAAKSCQ